MTEQYIRFDWAMKSILRQKENFEILEGFVSELLKEDVKIKKILESESNKERAEEKSNRVDMMVEDASGRMLLVEIQYKSEIDYFHRMLFGASRLICDYLEAGNEYAKVKKVITIHIVYFDIGQGKDYLYKGTQTFRGVNHPEDVLQPSIRQRDFFKIDHVSDIFPENYIIKLKKFHEEEAYTPFDEWMCFLKNGEIKPEPRAKGLLQAQNKLNLIKLNRKDQDAYRIFMRNLHDEASFAFNKELELKDREEKGRIEGMEKGKKEAKEEFFRKLVEDGMPEEKARKLAGLNSDSNR